MSWLSAAEPLAAGTVDRMAGDVAVIISGRAGYDAPRAQQDERDERTSTAYGGAWSGAEIILTHRPEEVAHDPTIIVLNCDIVEAIRRAQEIAGDRDVQIISADIARQALEHDLESLHQTPGRFGVPVADHRQHRLIPLLSHTHLPHLGSVKNQPKPVSSMSRKRVKPQPKTTCQPSAEATHGARGAGGA